MQILSWIGYTISILIVLCGVIGINVMWEEKEKFGKTIYSKVSKETIAVCSLVCFFGGILVFLYVDSGMKRDYVYISYEDKKAVVMENKKGYTNLLYSDKFEKRTMKNPYKEELDVDVASKEGKEFSITLKLHEYVVTGDKNPKIENEQIKKKINGITEKELNEKVDQKELTKMIQEEVKQYTAEELNSKLFLSNKLKEVEKTYNQNHFMQIKLFA